MKLLEIENENQYLSQIWLPNLALYCTQLETLKLYNVNIPDDGLETLSKTCHQLKSIQLRHVNHVGLDKLLKTNVNLRSLFLSFDSGAFPFILEILGLYCPLLQVCQIEAFIKDISDIQIETFSNGCPNLKVLHLHYANIPNFQIFQLLRCLGYHNPALEKLSLWKVKSEDVMAIDNNTILTREQCRPLHCLSNGWPLLKEIDLTRCKFSTPDVSYLVNHSIHLEVLILVTCSICDDGLIITKEADKLRYLKCLYLWHNPHITDESMINIVKGCYNLDTINIRECPKLTDASLFNIAANCPNLKNITLSVDGINITENGLTELVDKCLKLIDIEAKNIPYK